MDFDAELGDALASRDDVSALACMDGRAGIVLGMCVREDVRRDEAELVVLSAPELCTAPGAGASDWEDQPASESFVASADWIHAFVRVPTRPDLLVVGLAKSDANLTLLRAWLREVAGRVGQAS